jgi:DNA polymerase III subunit epsilon
MKPNLGEAYRHFTGTDLAGAHDAAVDVAACKAVYLALREQSLK